MPDDERKERPKRPRNRRHGRAADGRMLAWVMMGLAIWHFAIFLPDRFWGGIVGAFLGAIIGAVVFGLIVNGLTVPGRDDTRPADRARGDPGRDHRHRRSCTLKASGASSAREHCSAALGRSSAELPVHRAASVASAAEAAGACTAASSIAPCDIAATLRAARASSACQRDARAGARAPRPRRPDAARAWLAADEIATTRRRSRASTTRSRSCSRHVAAGGRITVHGDYDVDGVCSTAVLVRALRALGADVDWYLPEPHRGRLRPVARRRSSGSPPAARGCCMTVDCGDHRGRRGRAGARRGAWTSSSPTTTPARRRRAARRADRPSGGLRLPVPGAVRRRRRLQARAGAAASAGRDRRRRRDLDLVALATVADCVPLRGREPAARARAACGRWRATASRACGR